MRDKLSKFILSALVLLVTAVVAVVVAQALFTDNDGILFTVCFIMALAGFGLGYWSNRK